MEKDIGHLVKDWLQGPQSGKWILVLDNADNKLDFFPEEKNMQDKALTRFIPHGNKGTVIVTTRDREVADKLFGGDNVIKKSGMDQNEVRQLFEQHYQKEFDSANAEFGRDVADAPLLLKALQFLPLAVVQAASYLRLNPLISISKYLTWFSRTKADQKKILSKTFGDCRRDENVETILTTFSITFRQAQEQSPLAGSLLKLIACIDCQGIPHELLASSGLEGSDDEIDLLDALGKLINFSLLTKLENSKTYDMHSLVHV